MLANLCKDAFFHKTRSLHQASAGRKGNPVTVQVGRKGGRINFTESVVQLQKGTVPLASPSPP